MLLSLLLTMNASAAEEDAPILRIEGPDLYAALGREDGVVVGGVVRVYRVVEVRDPLTGRVLSDAFEVGEAEVVEVGQTLSRIRASARVVSRVQVGDQISLNLRPPQSVVTTAPERSSAPVRTEVRYQLPEDSLAFQAAFAEAAVSSTAEQEVIWAEFLAQWPDSSLYSAVQDELSALQEEAVAEEEPLTPLQGRATASGQVSEGEPLTVYLSLSEPALLQEALLYYRRMGEGTYRYTTLTPIGDTVFSGEVPAEVSAQPGVEWFVEGIAAEDGGTWQFGGTPTSPGQAEFSAAPITEEIVDRSQARIFYEYVDFYLPEAGADQYSHFEADFLYRIYTALYSIRVGAGVYSGAGGSVEDIEASGADAAIDVGYNYGYTELEFRLTPWLSAIGRGLVGVDLDGMAGGVEGRARLGPEAGTNLMFGAAKIGNIGNSYLLQLSWDTVERLPMAAGVHVTNNPGVSADDYGVRLTYEARYAVTDWLELGGRGGYQLRNINHTGPSAGLTAVFSW